MELRLLRICGGHNFSAAKGTAEKETSSCRSEMVGYMYSISFREKALIVERGHSQSSRVYRVPFTYCNCNYSIRIVPDKHRLDMKWI